MDLQSMDVPNETETLWRYLDFPKYVDLIKNKRIFFMRCDKLLEIDPHEGFFDQQRILEEYRNQVENFEEFVNFAREEHPKHLFVNCWHMNENESDAMWKVYSKENGIAIKTTFGKLKQSFGNRLWHPIYANKIRYVDHNNLIVCDDIIDRFSVKNHAYSHEKELRLLYPKPETPEIGVYVGIDVNVLIENIILAPASQEWFVNLVKSISSTFEVNSDKIKKSTLYRPRQGVLF